jgi:hypothetical protein
MSFRDTIWLSPRLVVRANPELIPVRIETSVCPVQVVSC